MRIEAQYFGLQSLKDQIDEVMKPKQPTPDDEIIIDARGTKIKTTRRVITKGKDCRFPAVQLFSSLFDPQSPKLLKAEDDGSYKIDADPRYVEEWLLAMCECESVESEDRVYGGFCNKYGVDMMDQWHGEFENKYC